MRTLLIDNHDSFTFNLFQLVARVTQAEPIVVRNHQVSWDEIRNLPVDNIILSPGPGRADRRSDFGICADVVRESSVPVLGVCLGHQGIAYGCGGRILLAPEPVHGRLSVVRHEGEALFAGIPRRFDVVRYHSQMVHRCLPPELEATAWTEDGIIMGLRHRSRPLWGVQFHPESISTEYGEHLIKNFTRLTHQSRTCGHWDSRARRLTVVPEAISAAPATGEFEVVSRKLNRMPDPERVFLHLYGGHKTAFWLDSSLVREGLARFSFMGDAEGPLSEQVTYRAATHTLSVTRGGQTTRRTGNIFNYLRQRLAFIRVPAGALPFDFNCGFVGYFGYELKQDCGALPGPQSTNADAQFLFADRLIAFDAQERSLYLVALVPKGDASAAASWMQETTAALTQLSQDAPSLDAPDNVRVPRFYLARDRETYLDDIRACLQRINAGETYEVCLTNQIRAHTQVSALDIYRRLRRSNPAPYAAYLALGGLGIACSSPERFLRVHPTGLLESKPIKGTAKRGVTPAEDAQLKEALQTSLKDRAENLMIVDLVRNDLGLVSEIGTVTVPQLMQVETYATVHQLVSTVQGQLREGMTAVDAVQALFPGGSMTGAPKRRTLEIIDSLEKESRGIYSGALGYLSLSGAADLNIVIRTAVVADSVVSVGVGGAVVALSEADAEFDEMLLKSKAVLRAILASTCKPGDVEEALQRTQRHLSDARAPQIRSESAGTWSKVFPCSKPS